MAVQLDVVSSFSFGGGYVVLPVIRRYFVEEGLFGEDELMDMAAVAQSSPGAIAINLAQFCAAEEQPARPVTRRA